MVGSTAVTAWCADLTKIDRTIAKEPAYKSKPAYCLLVFGPEAKTRVWLVRDGNVLYVDRNGNGNLTDDGEPVVSNGGPAPVFEAGDITEAGGRVKHTQLVLQFHDNDQGGIWTSLQMSIEGKVPQAASEGERLLRFAARPQDAPVVHFNGPLTIRIVTRTGAGAGERYFAEIGTPGLGPGTFATIDPLHPGLIPKDVFPVAEIECANRTPGGAPIRAKVALDHREH
jgi:hypothetical protein